MYGCVCVIQKVILKEIKLVGKLCKKNHIYAIKLTCLVRRKACLNGRMSPSAAASHPLNM